MKELKEQIKFEVEKLSPKKGDLLVFKMLESCNREQMRHLVEMIADIFPYKECGIKGLILREGIEVSINNKQLMELLEQVKCHYGNEGE